MVAHNYRSQDKRVMILKPSIDDRCGETVVSSRAGLSATADYIVNPSDDDFSPLAEEDVACILVDEAQFLSPRNVDALRRLTSEVPVMCYGLRTDYRTRLFPGSQRLLELADSVEEVKTTCVACSRKAIINAKYDKSQEKASETCDGLPPLPQPKDAKRIVKDGSSAPDLGAEEKYQPMCWHCWSA